MKPCIFCSNPRTHKRGEHVFDDWLNREHGKPIGDIGTTWYFGKDGKLLRSHPSIGIHVKIPVVCNPCNNGWMSEVTTLAKEVLEPMIRRDKATDIDEAGAATIAAFAFMKSAVLDWSAEDSKRLPCISRASCLAFRSGFMDDNPPSLRLPRGLQVWIARYKRKHAMEVSAYTEEVSSLRHLKGYKILVVTYIVGSFIFQVTMPRSTKPRNRAPMPSFNADDNRSAAIWPGVTVAYWPPGTAVTHRTFDAFRERFRHVRIRLS